MWKKGELVWISSNCSDIWIPGRILGKSESLGVLVSFFGPIGPRYVSKQCLRSFDRDFGSLVPDAWRFRGFVKRALRAHFWNISFGLWCSCQTPIDSPYFDIENSLPWFPHNSDSALGYVRDMAISLKLPLRKLAETNSSSAQILSFRRYSVDFKRSESVYKEIRECAKVMDHSEGPNWYVDQVSIFPGPELECGDVENSRDLSAGVPFPKDIPCYSSPSFEQHVDKVVQICTSNTRKPLTNSDSSIMKACQTMAQTADREEEDGRRSKSIERCQIEQSICLKNSEPGIDDMIEEHTTNAASEAPPDVMTEINDDIIGSVDRTKTLPLPNASNSKACMVKRLCFVAPGACKKQLACYVKESHAKPKNKLDNSKISAKTLDDESSDKNTFNGTRQNCSVDALESHVVEVVTDTINKEFSSDDAVIAPAEQLQDLDAATTVENQTGAVDNVRSNGIKRKASRDKSSAWRSKRKKKVGQQSVSTDKPEQLNLHLMKDMQFADPKCLRMKFLSRHGNIPSKSELLKKFSVFGKIDASRTDVNPEASSAKIIFLHSTDAVTAYQFARSKKFTVGRCKVLYRLDPFEEDNEANKVSASQKPQESASTPKSCLKNNISVDKEEGKGNLKVKVKFQMEAN